MTSPGGNVVEIVVRTRDESAPGFDAATRRAKGLAQQIDGGPGSAGAAFESAGRKATGFGATMSRVGAVAGGILLADAVQTGARRAMALMQSTVKAASDLGESINAVGKTFGIASAAIEKFGETSAEQVGLSTRAFLQAATPLGAMLKNQGLDIKTVADETINLTKRAADMASVFNTDVNEALFAIQAGLRGETEPLRRYGITLSEVSIQQQALAQTGKTAASQLTTQEKAVARLSLIYAQSASTAGDFQDTVDGLANAQRVSAAQIENAQAKIGTAYLPVAARAAQVTGQLAEVFGSLPGPLQMTIALIAGVGAAAVIAAPRIVAVNAALATMAANGGLAAKAMTGLVAVLGRATLVLAGLMIAREVAKETGVLNDVLGAVPGIGKNLVQTYGDTTSSLTKLESQTKPTWIAQKTLATAMEDLIEAGEELTGVWDKLHGAQATAHKSALQAKEAISGLNETFEENKFSLNKNTEAGLRNITALEDAARAAAEAADAYLKQTGDAKGAARMMDEFRRAAEKSIGATGKAKAEVHALAVELFKLPAFKEILIQANIRINGQNQLNRVLKDVDRLTNGQGFASGGIAGAASGGQRGGMHWVGEQGPELVRLPYGSTVYPSGQSMNMAAQMSGGVAVADAQPFVMNGGGLGQAVFDWIANEVRRRGGRLAVLGLKNPA